MATDIIGGRAVNGAGPRTAKIMIVGEAPGVEDERSLQPFSGLSGQELSRMCNEAGIPMASTYRVNVCRMRPPGGDIESVIYTKRTKIPTGFVSRYDAFVHPTVADGVDLLWKDIADINPDIIIALGDTALWALSEGAASSVSSWRGSQLTTHTGHRFIPTYSPGIVMRMWSWRAIVIADLRRAMGWTASNALEPEYRFIVRPSFQVVMDTIADLSRRAQNGAFRLAVDIETRSYHIACIGFAWSRADAICIPLMCVENADGYWTFDEEVAIIAALMQLLQHPNVKVVGQNFSYDAQYFFRHYLRMPNLVDDTMVMQHIAFAGMQKGLDFLSSLYCSFHRYWKEEGKLWDPRTTNEEQLWVYNCKDCVTTYEVADALESILSQLQLTEQYLFHMEWWWDIMIMTLRGVATADKERGMLARELVEVNMELDRRLTHIIGYQLNINSSKQMKEFLYGELKLPPIKNRKTGAVSANFESLQKLADREPLLRPIADIILTQRSVGKFVNTFLTAQLDADGRMRCSYNVAGPETNRLASSQNPFGSGMNMQNIPDGTRKRLLVKLPNVRKLSIPDPGRTMFDIDLDRADLQVVVWEADDNDLKRQLRLGVDLHVMNGILLAGKEPPPEDELIESHPNYHEHKARYKNERQLAKNFVHGTNYGGKEKTMAAVCGISVALCAQLQKRWFDLHPGIKRWHERVERSLQTRRFVTNAFGYRRYYFDRIDGVLPEALAWIPQSTVARVTAGMQHNVERGNFGVELLIQVHDSLVGQYLTSRELTILPQLHQACLIEVPYPDPLIIPVGLKTSTKSWGDCEERKWPDTTIALLK